MTGRETGGDYPSKQQANKFDVPKVAHDPSSRTATTLDKAPPSTYTLNADSNRSAKPVSTSLGRGSSSSEGDHPEVPDADLDGEQMRAPGEGEIYKAQFGKTGTGEAPEIGGDLERKKAEQQAAREEVISDRKKGLDVGS